MPAKIQAPIECFQRLRSRRFDYQSTHHADAIVYQHFHQAISEIEETLLELVVPVWELIQGGGGLANVTRRIGEDLSSKGWQKQKFHIVKSVNNLETSSSTHEIDHVKAFEQGVLALEIEWNNKDPFFDRDLTTFSRLHGNGAISAGIVITRGYSLQNGMENIIREHTERLGVTTFDELQDLFGLNPTLSHRNTIKRKLEESNDSFARIWSKQFVQSKFGTSTTHWNKLMDRFERGVGSPCPVIAIGIPVSIVQT